MSQLLEKDTPIILRRYGRETGRILKIDRVTENRAYCGAVKFKRQVSESGDLKEIGAEKWASHSYELGTPEKLEATRKANGEHNLRAGLEERLNKLILNVRVSTDPNRLRALSEAVDAFYK